MEPSWREEDRGCGVSFVNRSFRISKKSLCVAAVDLADRRPRTNDKPSALGPIQWRRRGQRRSGAGNPAKGIYPWNPISLRS